MGKEELINSDSQSPEEDENGVNKTRYDKKLLRTKLPADPSVLYSALQLASDKNIRISKLADTVLLDPIITLEVLSKANKTYSSADKAGITAVQTAVIRIGSENMAELFFEMRSREEIEDFDVNVEFEALRKLASRAGAVAEIMANHLQRDISETAQTAASLAYIGQMLCCKVLGRSYLEYASIKRRSALAYKLQSHFQIHLQKIHLEYLKDKGLPGFMFYAYDKDLKCKTSAQSSLRFITDSAVEIVEAIEDGKWDRYRSTHLFPTKSNLRLLKFHDGVFETIKEEIEDVLNFNKEIDSKPNIDEISFVPDATEISNLILLDTIVDGSSKDPSLDLTVIISRESLLEPDSKPTLVISRENLPEANLNQTLVLSRENLANTAEPQSESNEVKSKEVLPSTPVEYSRKELSVDSQAIYGLMQYLCQEADSVSTLLKDLMSILTEQGPFTRAAIIECSSPPKGPQIHSAIGEDFEAFNGNEQLAISDPLSPISLLATRVQSYNSTEKSDPSSPFGITSYAISPVTVSSIAPLILYADCGVSKPVPLEARKVFRMVVQLLHETLPNVAEKSQTKRVL